MGPTAFYGAGAEKPLQKADFAMKQTNICRLSGDIINPSEPVPYSVCCSLTVILFILGSELRSVRFPFSRVVVYNILLFVEPIHIYQRVRICVL